MDLKMQAKMQHENGKENLPGANATEDKMQH